MTGEVIKSFLVGLGFDVDDASLAKFNKSIVVATAKVTALYASVQLATAGIFKGIQSISEGFEEMGYQLRIVAPAINKFLILRQAMLSAYHAAGVNLTKVVQQSILFNYSLAKTKFALEAVYKSVGARFLPLLTKQMDIFRQKIFANMPKIQAALEKFVTFIFKAFSATAELGGRVYSILSRVWDFFVMLDDATGGWSTKILAVVAAWKFLNLEFLATPLGLLLTGLLGILALYDDFMVWKEGGKSFFDWGSEAAQIMVGLAVGIGGVVAAIYAWNVASKAWIAISGIVETVLAVLDGELSAAAIALAIIEAPIWAIVGAVAALAAALTAVDAKWGVFGGALSGSAAALGSGVMNLIGGGGGALHGAANPSPLLPSGGGNNQRVNQETNITIQGSADANSVGKAVASEQSKVNFDLTRNLKGAMR